MLTQLRERQTPTGLFARLVGHIGVLLAYEATRDLALEPRVVQTPLESFEGKRLAAWPTIVPILRAGLGIAEEIFRFMPEARMGHIGLYRDEASLKPVQYYEKLPAEVASGPVLLVDPMLATGGSAAAAIDLLKQRGCKDIRAVCLVAAPEGVAELTHLHPDIRVFVAALDRGLNEKGYILPGLGDAGDRLFGTHG